MKVMSFVRCALVALAGIGVMAEGPAMAAARSSAPVKKVMPAGTIFDISLSQEGVYTGRVVDHTGAPVEGAAVVVKQGKTDVAKAVTDKNGEYSVKNMKNGVYTVASGSTVGTYRFWSEKSAPPSAKANGLLVIGENGARGQCGSCDAGGGGDWLLAGVGALALAALVVGIIALEKANDHTHPPVSP